MELTIGPRNELGNLGLDESTRLMDRAEDAIKEIGSEIDYRLRGLRGFISIDSITETRIQKLRDALGDRYYYQCS